MEIVQVRKVDFVGIVKRGGCNTPPLNTKAMKRTIGTLTLISYTQGFDWEVYDEDGEYQGIFCGDINNTSEEEIWDGL